MFFIAIRKRMGNNLHYIIRAVAYVHARKHRRILTDGKHLIHPGRSARSLQKNASAFDLKRKDVLVQTQGRFGWNALTFFQA